MTGAGLEPRPVAEASATSLQATLLPTLPPERER